MDDSREVPSYTVWEAAHYLLVPRATLRSWALGQRYRTARGWGMFRPLLRIASRRPDLLSFTNLVEAHVLDALRRDHKIPMQKVRKALDYLERELPTAHPLADHRFQTAGVHLFVQRYASLVSLSENGQMAIREALEHHLRRVEWDRKGLPIQLYPYTRKRGFEEPRHIVIDPAMSFGRPSLAGTGIATTIIVERYKAGESVDDLVQDYDVPRPQIEEAIRCEIELASA